LTKPRDSSTHHCCN